MHTLSPAPAEVQAVEVSTRTSCDSLQEAYDQVSMDDLRKAL